MDRRVNLFIAVSVDGYIAKVDGALGWLQGEDTNIESDYGYADFIKNVDTVVMGYKTYRQIVDHLSPEDWPYQEMKTYVFTHQEQENMENVEFVCCHIKDFLLSLKGQEGKNIWICGGAEIINQCMENQLLDEIYLTVIPIILGSGIRLFYDGNPVQELKLKETMQCNGVMNVRYCKR